MDGKRLWIGIVWAGLLVAGLMLTALSAPLHAGEPRADLAWPSTQAVESTRQRDRLVHRKEKGVMATENFWKGTDGDWNVGANWTAGVVPTTGHVSVYTGRHSQYDCDVNITLGLTGPNRLIVMDDYYGSIGGPGNWLTNNGGTIQSVVRGHGDYFLSGSSVGAEYVVVDTREGTTYLYGNLAATIDVKRGRCVINGTGAIRDRGRIATWGETAHLTFEASTRVTYPAIFHCAGGKMINRDDTDPLDIVDIIVGDGGEFLQTGIIDTLTHCTINGIMKYFPEADPAAETLNAYVNGVLDVSDSDWEIPVGIIVLGPQGEIRGSALEGAPFSVDLDLTQDYP